MSESRLVWVLQDSGTICLMSVPTWALNKDDTHGVLATGARWWSYSMLLR